MLQDLIDGVNWTVEEGIVDPERVAVMGGYFALAGVTLESDTFACSVNIGGRADMEFAYRAHRRWGFQHEWIGGSKQHRHAISPSRQVSNISVPSFHYYVREEPGIHSIHARTMKRQLQKHNKPHEFHLVDYTGRSTSAENHDPDKFRLIEAFLSDNL